MSWPLATDLLKCYQSATNSRRFSQHGIIFIFIVAILDLLTPSSRQKTFCSVDNISRKTVAKQERTERKGQFLLRLVQSVWKRPL